MLELLALLFIHDGVIILSFMNTTSSESMVISVVIVFIQSVSQDSSFTGASRDFAVKNLT